MAEGVVFGIKRRLIILHGPVPRMKALGILEDFRPKLIVQLYGAKKADESSADLRAAIKEASADTEIVAIRNAEHEPPDINWKELESLVKKVKEIWGEERCIAVHCEAGVVGAGTLSLLLLAEALRLEGLHSDSESQNVFLKEYLDKVWTSGLNAS